MTREEAYTILQKYLTNPNLIKHSLATEASMKALYKYLSKNSYTQADELEWAITGLLHDADYELVKGKPELHGLFILEKEPHIPERIAHAISAHNYSYTKVDPQSLMDWSIACCDQLTGLIIACALITPEKKLAVVTPDFVLKRFNEKSFAKGADRNSILMCESKLGIPLLEFITIVLTSMQEIHDTISL